MKLNYLGTDIHYTVKGTGNPLIFLHGFLESSKIWEPFLPALVQKRQVICIDLPGHGKTGNLGEVHSMELMANVVKSVLDFLNISKAGFIGHSMGGYVCLSFLEKYPLLVKNLVLLNSSPEEDSEERKQTRERAAKLIKKNKSAYVNMAISNLTNVENSKKYEIQLNDLKKEALQFSSEGIIACLEGMKIRTNKSKVLRLFKGSKYMVIGKRDPVINIEITIKAGNSCNCTIILTENGHLSHLENFAEVEEILHFID